jgi:hypothetical protein
MPDLREIDERIWFKLRLDDKGKWKPARWETPALEEHIQTVLADPSLKTPQDRTKRLCEVTRRSEFACSTALRSGKWPANENKYAAISRADFNRQLNEPVRFSIGLFWLYRNRLVKVVADEPEEELALRVKHKVLSHEKALAKIQREVDAFENFERLGANRRAPIPETVRMFVWQRDGGRCVTCGCQERLEYDHIIPLAAGGSSTERNIQLLCESCNRKKGAAV